VSTLTTAGGFFLRLRWERFAPGVRGCFEGLVLQEAALPVRTREPEVGPIFAGSARRLSSGAVRVVSLTNGHAGVEPFTIAPTVVRFATALDCVEDLVVVPARVEQLADTCSRMLPGPVLALELGGSVDEACVPSVVSSWSRVSTGGSIGGLDLVFLTSFTFRLGVGSGQKSFWKNPIFLAPLADITSQVHS